MIRESLSATEQHERHDRKLKSNYASRRWTDVVKQWETCRSMIRAGTREDRYHVQLVDRDLKEAIRKYRSAANAARRAGSEYDIANTDIPSAWTAYVALHAPRTRRESLDCTTKEQNLLKAIRQFDPARRARDIRRAENAIRRAAKRNDIGMLELMQEYDIVP